MNRVTALAVFILITVLAAPVAAKTDPLEVPSAVFGETGTPVSGQAHMVVTAHPLASQSARNVLRAGGTAIDAAIAAQAVLGLVEPQSSGIGGGAFLLHYDAASGTVTSWDGRETAPAAATPDRFLDEDGAPRPWPEVVPGGLSVGVPGVVRMLHEVHERHGEIAWANLFDDAIALAHRGFGISPRLNEMLSQMGAEAFSPNAREYFFDDEDTPHPLGYVLRNPEYADALERIAQRGPDALYDGVLTEAVVDAVTGAWRNPGDMSVDDLAGYRAVERPAVCQDYRDYHICGMGPPSSGGITTLMTLAMIAPHNLGDAPSPEALHVIAEALDLAFADRNRYIADPDFVDVPAGLLDRDYLAERAGLIDPDAARGGAQPGDPPGAASNGADATEAGGGTSHISIVDGAGNAVSMTTTIEYAFGSRLMASGFLLNNELTDFSFAPEDDAGRRVANRVEAGKRPRSSMAPTLVLDSDGALKLIVGSPGGASIIPYVVKAIIAHIDWGMDPQAASALFNFASPNAPLRIERLPGHQAWRDALEVMGHEVDISEMTSGLNIIAIDESGLAGGTDPRREGAALAD